MTETFQPGDEVELTPIGIRVGLARRHRGKPVTTGKVTQVFDKTIRVARDGWGGNPGTYSKDFWRKKPTLTQAEIASLKVKRVDLLVNAIQNA